MFALAREILAAGDSLILEGNFRSGEHETALRAAFPADSPNILQVLCRADEAERRARIFHRSDMRVTCRSISWMVRPPVMRSSNCRESGIYIV